MSTFTPAGSGGVPITTQASGATNPTISQLPMPVSGTEYSFILPSGTRQYRIRPQVLASLQLAFEVGESTTNYVTVPRGSFHAESDLLLTTPITVYIQSNQPLQTLEVLVWT